MLQLMAKKRPPGTVGHTLFLPEDLHRKIVRLSTYGKADDLIIECLTKEIEPRYQRWLEEEIGSTKQQAAAESVVDVRKKPAEKTPRSVRR
jgi:hypothetical protein